MKKLISILLLCAVLCMTACGNNKQTEPDNDVEQNTENGSDNEDVSGGDDLSKYENKATVMCYNIFYKDVADRSDDIQDLILKNNPDILLLQEVSVDWIPYLQNFMSENGYSYYGYGRHGGELSDPNVGSGDQFTPVLWKTEKYDLVESGHFWLSSTPEVYSAAWLDGIVSKYPRCVNWVILKDKETGGELLATSVHTDPESEQVRTNSSMLIAEKITEIRGERPAVLGGDWNMKLTDDAYRAVNENGYPDIRITAEETTMSGSFNAWGERADDNFAFGDHIFATDNVAAKYFEVVDDYYDGVHISDHNPLLTEIYY